MVFAKKVSCRELFINCLYQCDYLSNVGQVACCSFMLVEEIGYFVFRF